MNVYIDSDGNNSWSYRRVVVALRQYKPSNVTFTDEKQADFIIYIINGRQEHFHRKTGRDRKPYAIIQFSVRSTQKPSTEGWLPLWNGARLVWSYLDLETLCYEDRVSPEFNFYHAPLGVDSAVFTHLNASKTYLIATSGLSYLTESVREAILAARRSGKRVFHLGKDLGQTSDVVCGVGIDDKTLAVQYNHCEYVSGLRRCEGFELPAVEGLFCGARPIFFDRLHYKQWFSDLGVFIPETPREQVIHNLEAIFNYGVPKVTEKEREMAIKRFNWQTILDGFWNRIL